MAAKVAASGCQLKRSAKKLRREDEPTAIGKKKKKTMFSLQELLCKDVEALNTATNQEQNNNDAVVDDEEAQ